MDKEIKQLKTENAKDKKASVQKDIKKRLKYGGYSTIMVILLVAIVIVLNIAVSLVETSKGLKLDLTSNKIYTLSKLTEDVVKGLKDELVIYIFADNNKQNSLIEKTLERYSAVSDKITVRVVDPAKNPTLQRKFSNEAVTVTTNTIVATNKNETQFRVITPAEMYSTNEESGNTYWVLEQKLTGALMFLSSDIQTNVYLLSGHGERVDDQNFASAVQTLTERLRDENYKVEKLNLATEGSKLVKGDIIMVLGPTGDLTADEREKFITFLENHGKAVFFMDPGVQTPQPNFDAVLDYYMIRIKDDIVMEQEGSKFTEKSRFELVPDLKSHDITDAIINQNVPVYVDSAASIECYQPESPIVTVNPLLVTSGKAVSVPVADFNDDSYKNKLANYIMEQKLVGLAIEQVDPQSQLPDAQTRIVVYSTSEIALGSRQNSLGNMNLITNSVNWVDNRLEQLYIRGTLQEAYKLTILNYNTVYILIIIIMIIIPLLTLAGGVFIWRRRKNL